MSRDRSRGRSPLYWLAFAAGLAWSALLWARSPRLSSPLDDEIGHFLISRDVPADPALALDLWGRAINTVVYVPSALLGLEAARGFSLLIAAATVLVATRVAELLGVRCLALVPVLLWFQPWFHGNSTAVLTELPFTLALIGGCCAWLSGRTTPASVLFGVLPLVRHEGIAMLGLWCLLLLAERRWRAIAIAVAPFLLYQAAYALVFDEPPFGVYFGAEPTKYYGSGGWTHFALPLIRSASPVVALLAAVGLVLGWRDRRLILMAVPFTVYLLLQVVFFRFGLFGSGGLAVFLLPLAPFLAVTAALGAQRLAEAAARRTRWRHAGTALAGVAALGTVLYGLRSTPLQPDPAAGPIEQAVRMMERRGLDAQPVTSTHVWFYELSGQRLPARVGHVDAFDTPWSRPRPPRSLAPSTVVVWDCFYSDRFGLRWRDLRASGFRELGRFGSGEAVVLRKGGGGRPLGPRPSCSPGR